VASERTARGDWKGGWLCHVAVGDFTITVDEPESVVGGTNQGPQPTDLLLASVASCFALALAHAARKRSVPLHHLSVDVTGVYDGPRFESIRVDAEVGCEEHELDRLLTMAERVCYVTNTLRGGPELIIDGTVVPGLAAVDEQSVHRLVSDMDVSDLTQMHESPRREADQE